MAELVELLQNLPLPALLVFAAVLAAVVGVRFLGVWQGMKAPPSGAAEGGGGRILGAVIDSKKADEIIAALNKVAGELADSSDSQVELANAIRANTASVVAAGDDITNARVEIRELTREIARSAK